MKEVESVKYFGSSALSVLSNKEKASRVGLVRQPARFQGARDDFLWKTSLNALLHWLLGGSTQRLSTESAEEPKYYTPSDFGDAASIRAFFEVHQQAEPMMRWL